MAPKAMLALMIVLLAPGRIAAQSPPNLPPPGSYQPIPNFTGVGAGLQFRKAINDRFSGSQSVSPSIVSLALADLPTEQDGTLLFCKDCKNATPCVAGGAGAWALGARGLWSCSGGALEANLNANGNRIVNLATASNTGDALGVGQASGGDLGGTLPNPSVQTVLSGRTPLALGTSGQLALTGAKSDGSDAIARVSVNGVANVKAYGASGSTTTCNLTTTASSTSATCNAIGDFAAGQHVKIDHAGAASDAVTPTALAIQPQSYALNPNPTSDVTHNGCNTDSTAANGHNTSCAVNHTYRIVGVSANGGWSAPTAAVSTAAGPQTLSPNNNIVVSWTGNSADIAYLIYHCQGAACTPTLVAAIPHHGAPGATAQSYRDFGHARVQDESKGTALQAGAIAQDVLTTITAVSGNTVTLAGAPAQSGAFTMRHDDAPAIQAAIDSLCAHTSVTGATNGAVYFPGPAKYQIAQTLSLYGCYGSMLQGSSQIGDGAFPSMLQWHGPTGGTLLNLNRTADSSVKNLALGLLDGSGNTPGVCIDSDKYSTGGAGDAVSVRHNTYEHLQVNNCAVGIRLQNRGGSNNENNIFLDVQISNAGSGKGGTYGYEIGGGGQTYNETVRGGEIWGQDVALLSDFAGQIDIHGVDFELDDIVYWDSNRLGGEADGNLIFDTLSVGNNYYFIYNGGGGDNSHQEIRNVSMLGGTGPNGFAMHLNRRTLFEHSHICENSIVPCVVATNDSPIISILSSYSDPLPFQTGTGGFLTDKDATATYVQYFDVVNQSGAAFGTGLKNHAPTVDACVNNGVVAANATLSFSRVSCQRISTLTTGLTYTLSTTGVKTDQTVTVESYITGSVGAGPVWATSSGAIKWAGGAAPVSSVAAGSVDIIKLTWDGTNWLEVSRSIGNH